MGRTATGTDTLETRLNDPSTVQKAHRLMTLLGARNADLVRGALDVFDWCVRQVQEGRHIASLDESGDVSRVREFSSPLLEVARRHDRIVLHAEAFGQIVELIDRPAQPTDALRQLMAEAYGQTMPAC